MHWIKQQPCVICACPGPSIADHLYGSAFIHNKVLIGHYALLPYCEVHDAVKTIHGRGAYNAKFKDTQAESWLKQLAKVPADLMPPQNVINAVRDWGR
jgi:hypothetical protein